MSSSSAPPILSPLIGREHALQRAEELLGEARLLTIVGPPGIGKTRLALAVRAAHSAQDGWIDLSTAGGAPDVCARIAGALGLRPSWVEPYDLVEELGWAIDGLSEVWLFLDHADGCVGALADVVSRVLSQAPSARAIVTSRERLGLAGEALLELGPLALPSGDADVLSAAERLLLSGAGRQAPRDARERTAIRTLVRALEGVPLAIELASARLALFGVEELIERLRAPLDVLDARAPRGGGGTLREALEASYRLLTEEERRALAACALFAGSFSTEAAEAVIGPGAVGLLAALRDKSLLARDAGRERARHRLYATVRAFAAERLEELGLADDVHRRHAAHFVALAEREVGRLDGPEGPDARHALAAELDELRLALPGAEGFSARASLVLGITAVLVTRGPPAEALDAIAPLLVAAPPGPARLALQIRRGEALEALGRITEAVDAYREALAGVPEVSAVVSGSRHPAAALLSAIARAELARGGLDEASRAASNAVAEAPPHTAAKVDAVRARGLVAHARGRLDDAVRDYEEARALADELGLVHRAACASADIAAVRLSERRLEEARELLEGAIERIHPEVDPVALGLAEGNLAILEQELGRAERAEALYTRGAERLRRAGHRLYTAHLLGYGGALEHERGRIDAAVARYDQALTVLRRVGDARVLAVIAGLCAAAEAARGRLDAARERIAEAALALEQVDDPGVRFAHRVHRVLLELAEARAASAGDGSDTIDAAHSAASALMVEAEGAGVLRASDDARIAGRLLAAAVRKGALGVDEGQCALRLPDGTRVSLATRAVLWRIVRALVVARRERPGVGLDVDSLLDAGWPTERMRGASGVNRLKVALSTLRKLGLRDLLVRTDDGYCLDPAVPLDERG